MRTRRVVEATFGGQVRQQLRRVVPHPVVGVRARDAVLAVLERLAPRLRRPHGRQRTPARSVAAAGLLLACLAPGLALSGAAAPAQAADKTTFTVGFLTEVDSFNPFLGYQAIPYDAWSLTYDLMINYSMKDMSPQPGLATKWTTSDDGRTWTFDIRKGVKWSDGQDLTARDIAFTYNKVLSGSPWSTNWESYLKGVTSVTAPDDTHVVLKLSQPNAVLPLLPIPIGPEHVWKDVSDKEAKI